MFFFNYFCSCFKTNIYTRIKRIWNKRCVLLINFAKSGNMNKIGLVTFRLTRNEFIFCCWNRNLVSISGIQFDLKSDLASKSSNGNNFFFYLMDFKNSKSNTFPSFSPIFSLLFEISTKTLRKISFCSISLLFLAWIQNSYWHQ